MSVPSLASIIATTNDVDLTERLIAAAVVAGVEGDPHQFVHSNLHSLAVAKVTESGDTVASVYDYAVATYKPSPRPGENPAAVTDAHLIEAVRQVANLTEEAP